MPNNENDNTIRSRFEMRAPKALTDKLMSYIAPDSGWVLVTDCEQYGDALPDVVRAHPETEFTLTTPDEETKKELEDAYDHLKNAKLIKANSSEYIFTDGAFDLIISIPPFGRRLHSREENFPMGKNENLEELLNLIRYLNKDGKLVIVLPSMITFRSGNDAQLRGYIESNYSIREISILPDGLFRPLTAIQTYLFVFSTGVTDDVLVRQYEPDRPISAKSTCRELVLLNETTLPKEDFDKLNGWNVGQVFYKVTDEKKAYDASAVPKVMIKDVATVTRGKAVSTKSEDGRFGVIGISDITDTGIDYSHIDRMDAEDRKIEKYLLQEGDVLVSTRGTNVKVAVVEKMPMKCIPSVNLIVIRTDKELLRGAYLKLFLESPVGTQMLESLQRGGSVININYKDVEALEVPAPRIDLQDNLIRKYNEGLERYKESVSIAEKEWNKTRQEVQGHLF